VALALVAGTAQAQQAQPSLLSAEPLQRDCSGGRLDDQLGMQTGRATWPEGTV
jgi:hypothetical protein